MTERRKHRRGDDRRKLARHHSGLVHLENLTHEVYRRHVGEKKAGDSKAEHPSHPHKHSQE